ncbi:hypothetical protein MHU86_16991 [Fragilaria crotonensis]|nr:hypothetical protein MHU86_16991 [Fragilaria crotonensis]
MVDSSQNIATSDNQTFEELHRMSPVRHRRRKTLDTSRNITHKNDVERELRQIVVVTGSTSVVSREYQASPPGMRGILRVKSLFESLQLCGLKGAGLRKESQRTVFSTLEVREYPMILGDNPSCLEGPPISIDWAHDPSTQFILDVNTFERMRGIRRRSDELVLSRSAREKRIKAIGFSSNDIAKVVRQVRKERHHRMVSSQQSSLDPIHEAVESATSGIKKMFAFKRSYSVLIIDAECQPVSGVPS